MLLVDEVDALMATPCCSCSGNCAPATRTVPQGYPQSVVLCGVRDVRDYRIRSRAENALVAGGCAFSVKAESLRLGDFSQEQVRALLVQHTTETWQAWTDAAPREVWDDRASGKSWDEKVFRREEAVGGARVTVWGM